MNNYFKAITLGAFTWRDEERIALFFSCIKKIRGLWLVLHYLLLTVCLAFPVTLIIARLDPFSLWQRLYGDNFLTVLTESAPDFLAEYPVVDGQFSDQFISAFNMYMIDTGYGGNVLMPMLSMTFFLMVIIQTAFYLSIVFFLGLSRMNMPFMNLHDRFGLAAFSSTLPVLAMALFGLFLPTVHIILFYFIVMFFVFQRSKLLQNI